MVCNSSDPVSKLRASLPIDWVIVNPTNILIMRNVDHWCKLSEAQIKDGETLYAVNQSGEPEMNQSGKWLAFYTNQELFVETEETKEKEKKEMETAEQEMPPPCQLPQCKKTRKRLAHVILERHGPLVAPSS